MAAVLTPGLTPLQKQRLADALRRIGGLPLGSITTLFLDCDVAAARALNATLTEPTSCQAVVRAVAAEHQVTIDVAGFTYGMATGVRLGRSFAPEPKPRSKAWISEEYRQLTEPNRRDAAKYIRKLLKAQGVPRPTHRAYGVGAPATAPTRGHTATTESDGEAAKRWAREMGRVAAGSHRRNKRTLR